jgi:RNA polymerase-binding protein DksA
MHSIERNLQRMRHRLLENLQRMEQENIRVPPRVANGDLHGSDGELADLASEHYERENSLELYLYEQELLKAIDQALDRIQEGTYGTCTVCSRPINPRRLLAVPNAKLCLDCQQEKERNGHGSRVIRAHG